jgi:hypothetical protein
MNDELVNALRKYLADTFRDRHYCPHCVGLLPDNHYPDCTLGQLEAAYRRAQLPTLQLETSPVVVTKIPATKQTGRKKSLQPVATTLF